MDDFTLGGPEDVVNRDIAEVTSTGANLGLCLNVQKCEIVHPQGTVIKSAILGSFTPVTPEDAVLLGAPLLHGKKLNITLDMCCSTLSRAVSMENHVFFQRVSLAVQRYNSVSFKGTFTVPTE